MKIFRDVSAFKLYMSDVGLLCAFSNIMPEHIIKNELSDVYKGALAENYIAQTLKANGYDLYYWTSDSPLAELDFVIQRKGKVVPIEVKYDTNVHAGSLSRFIRMYQPEYSMRITGRNFGEENGTRSVPLYAAFCI